MLFALGLGDRVAAVTHECDYPPGAEQLPHLTRSVIPEHLEAAEIDAAAARSVASLTSNGTKRARRPASAKASRRRRVFSDVPEPSSTSVSALVRDTTSAACATSIPRSVRVG